MIRFRLMAFLKWYFRLFEGSAILKWYLDEKERELSRERKCSKICVRIIAHSNRRSSREIAKKCNKELKLKIGVISLFNILN